MPGAMLTKWQAIKHAVVTIGGITGALMLAIFFISDEMQQQKPWRRELTIGWVGGSFAVMFSGQFMAYYELNADNLETAFMVGGILGALSLPFLMMFANLVKHWADKDLLDLLFFIRGKGDKP